METVAVSALVNILVPKLMAVYSRKDNLRKDLKNEIGHIKDELVMMNATIEDNHKWGTRINKTREVWIKKVRKFAQDTDDCIDCFLHPAAHKRLSPEDFARKIKHLKTASKAIQARNPWPARQGEEAVACEEESDQDQNDDSSHLVGMEGPIGRLLELVGEPAPNKVKRKVISIVGFGGLGKTLLASRVYDNTRVRQQFPLRARVHAAGDGALEVLRKICKELENCGSIKTDVQQSGSQASTLRELSKHVESCLKGKRYFIVIDDIRTQVLWHRINSAFPQDVDGRIIVTTTMQPVANACTFENGSIVYKMPTLSTEMSLELFYRAVPSEQPPAQMNGGLTGLLQKCDGLPLALVSVLNYLKSKGKHIFKEKTCREACRRFRTCLVEDLEFRRMRDVLAKKYDGLPDHGVKACLLYFYLFPGDDPVRGGSLTRKCLAEGFVKEKAQYTHQEVVTEYLDTLVKHSIMKQIQVSNRDKVKSCRPHGVVLEYISYKSVSENFINFLCGQEDTLSEEQLKNARRFSLHDGAAGNKNCMRGADLSLVRTLVVSGKACNAVMDFSKYELLGVLDLKKCNYKLKEKQLDDICELLQLLKYLSLGDLEETISKLPRKMGKLILLETLEMRRNEEPMGVFEEVIMLPRLKHLIGKFKFQDSPSKKLENFLSDDSMLETVSGFVTGNSGVFAWLMSRVRMVHLRKVKIWYDSNADQQNLNVDLTEAIKKFTLHQVNDIGCSLSIHLATYSEEVLKSVQDGGSLASLKLSGDLTKYLPSTQVRSLPSAQLRFPIRLNCIQELCLSWTQLSGHAILSALSNLVDLKDLKLVEDDLGPLVLEPDGFVSLERICLVCEASLDITIQAKALPRLVSFHMICEALGGPAGIQIGDLAKLNEIALHPRVAPGIKQEWKDATHGHPNRPSVLFIDHSKSRVQVQHVPITRRRRRSAINKLSSSIAKLPTIMKRVIPRPGGCGTIH